MKFEPGHKLAKGRPLGSLNRRTSELISKLEDGGFDPASELIDCYHEARKAYGKMSFADGLGYLKIASEIAKDLAGFCYPKIKAVEQIKGSLLDGMTPQEKLDAMKQAVALMESQVNESKTPR